MKGRHKTMYSKEKFFLYVWTEDINGQRPFITGKGYETEGSAVDHAKRWTTMPGYHAQVISGTKILFKA